MGQHNSHIYNDTEEDVVAILTDHDNRNSQVRLKSKDVKCIPTVKGRVTLSVFKEDVNNKEGSCCYTDDSDRSFIVRADKKKNLEILRAKYGSVKDVELQRRNVDEELRRIRTRMIRTLALLSEWTKRRFRKNLEPNMAR